MTGMTLKVVTPTGVVLNEPVAKVVARGSAGAFGLLPRHVDYVSDLVPSVLVHVDEEGRERFLGVNLGTLVKCGPEVVVATRDAIPGTDLATLEAKVEESFRHLDEQERVARGALARLEAGLVRRFLELGSEAT